MPPSSSALVVASLLLVAGHGELEPGPGPGLEPVRAAEPAFVANVFETVGPVTVAVVVVAVEIVVEIVERFVLAVVVPGVAGRAETAAVAAAAVVVASGLVVEHLDHLANLAPQPSVMEAAAVVAALAVIDCSRLDLQLAA